SGREKLQRRSHRRIACECSRRERSSRRAPTLSGTLRRTRSWRSDPRTIDRQRDSGGPLRNRRRRRRAGTARPFLSNVAWYLSSNRGQGWHESTRLRDARSPVATQVSGGIGNERKDVVQDDRAARLEDADHLRQHAMAIGPAAGVVQHETRDDHVEALV